MSIISKTYESLEFDKIKSELSKFAKFEQSRNLCLTMPIHNDFDKIKEQIELTREAKKILDLAKETPTEFIADIGKIENNASLSYLEEQELVDLAKTMKSSRLLKKFINENSEDDFILKQKVQNLISDKETEDFSEPSS